MKCQACGTETMMPFRCPFCGGQFCSAHRLPENHRCLGISQARTQTQDRVMTQQGYNSYSYSYVAGQDPYRRQHRIKWSQKEVQHIGIAAALVIGIGYSMALFGFYGFNYDWLIMSVFALVLTASFLVHEIAHKVFAQKAGMWAEFRLTTWGAVLTFISVFFPFKMIAPGAMMIGGNPPSAKEMVKISVAGVITNMIFSAMFLGLTWVFLPVSDVSYWWWLMLVFSAYINAFMAIFNLIPFGVLDGYKLFLLNKKLWAVAFIPAAILTGITGYMLYFVA
ncbi:MAG: AN1-type zinc finger domain-containing protein [Candidatus Bathyarchaeia archaeon]